jgi:hypothetical protein
LLQQAACSCFEISYYLNRLFVSVSEKPLITRAFCQQGLCVSRRKRLAGASSLLYQGEMAELKLVPSKPIKSCRTIAAGFTSEPANSIDKQYWNVPVGLRSVSAEEQKEVKTEETSRLGQANLINARYVT